MITPFREKPNRIPVAVIPELEGATTASRVWIQLQGDNTVNTVHFDVPVGVQANLEPVTESPNPEPRVPNPESRVSEPAYSGMFPCFFGGFRSRLVSSAASAAMSFLRVCLGSITSSMNPRCAAM